MPLYSQTLTISSLSRLYTAEYMGRELDGCNITLVNLALIHTTSGSCNRPQPYPIDPCSLHYEFGQLQEVML